MTLMKEIIIHGDYGNNNDDDIISISACGHVGRQDSLFGENVVIDDDDDDII